MNCQYFSETGCTSASQSADCVCCEAFHISCENKMIYMGLEWTESEMCIRPPLSSLALCGIEERFKECTKSQALRIPEIKKIIDSGEKEPEIMFKDTPLFHSIQRGVCFLLKNYWGDITPNVKWGEYEPTRAEEEEKFSIKLDYQPGPPGRNFGHHTHTVQR